MKGLRGVLALVAILGVVAFAIVWANRGKGCATPGECLETYYSAARSGDATLLATCLAEPLRSSVAPEVLRKGMSDLKGWTQIADPVINGAEATVSADEQRAASRRRVPF